MPTVKIYLDIDGVILANEFNMANYCHEFLEYLTSNFDVYWLTTHCRGDARQAVDRLSLVLPPKTLKLAKKIKPTEWREAKTEAIDFSVPFLWFDDDLFDDERRTLQRHKALDNWIEVNLAKDVDHLNKFVQGLPFPIHNGQVVEIR